MDKDRDKAEDPTLEEPTSQDEGPGDDPGQYFDENRPGDDPGQYFEKDDKPIDKETRSSQEK